MRYLWMIQGLDMGDYVHAKECRYSFHLLCDYGCYVWILIINNSRILFVMILYCEVNLEWLRSTMLCMSPFFITK